MGKPGYILLVAAGVAGVLALWQWQQSDIEALTRRVDTLEGELSELSARTEGIHPGVTGPQLIPGPGRNAASRAADGQAATSTSATAPAPPAKAPLPLLGQSGERALQAVLAALESERPEIQDKVREVVRAQQEALWEERRERRQAMWEQRQTERLEKLAADVNLSQQQVDALFAILTASRDRVGELFRQARESQSFEGVHEQAERVRQEADGEAKALLDDRQYEAYEAMRQEQRDRRRQQHRPPPP